MSVDGSNIVIVGGGFAGTTLARRLERRLPESRQLFLLKDLLEGPIGREQPVARQNGLHAVLDHVPVEPPIVVGFLLLGAGVGREQEREGDGWDETVAHG